MKPAKHHFILPFLGIIALSTALFSACAGNAPKPVAVGPVPSANGVPGTNNNPPSSSDATGGLKAQPYNPPDSHAQTPSNPNPGINDNTGNNTGAGGTPAGPAGQQPPAQAQAPAAQPPEADATPTNCTAYYNLGYGDAYRGVSNGPWLAKNNPDYTVACVINAPACTANSGDGLGTQFTVPGHGKLTFAKLTDANKGMEDVCIVAKLTGT